MATLNQKIKIYLINNGKVYRQEINNYIVQNDGSGDFLKFWNVSGLAEPNASQLNSLEDQADIDQRNDAVRGTRRNAYPSIEDQLDDIYHNGIDAWKATIKVTKDKYPK